jgi:CheY-like chemotaxis protein
MTTMTRVAGKFQAQGKRVAIVTNDQATDLVDNADTLATLGRMLGHDVIVAYDAFAALKAAAAYMPRVAFVDIAVPRFDGYCTATEIRRSHDLSCACLIAMSGYADQPTSNSPPKLVSTFTWLSRSR